MNIYFVSGSIEFSLWLKPNGPKKFKVTANKNNKPKELTQYFFKRMGKIRKCKTFKSIKYNHDKNCLPKFNNIIEIMQEICKNS